MFVTDNGSVLARGEWRVWMWSIYHWSNGRWSPGSRHYPAWTEANLSTNGLSVYSLYMVNTKCSCCCNRLLCDLHDQNSCGSRCFNVCSCVHTVCSLKLVLCNLPPTKIAKWGIMTLWATLTSYRSETLFLVVDCRFYMSLALIVSVCVYCINYDRTSYVTTTRGVIPRGGISGVANPHIMCLWFELCLTVLHVINIYNICMYVWGGWVANAFQPFQNLKKFKRNLTALKVFISS